MMSNIKPEQNKSNMRSWIIFIFCWDQFLLGEVKKCQVLNVEVDLSWYEQPSRRSHLDQSMFCRVLKTANKCGTITLGQLLPAGHRRDRHYKNILQSSTPCWIVFVSVVFVFSRTWSSDKVKQKYTVCVSAQTTAAYFHPQLLPRPVG